MTTFVNLSAQHFGQMGGSLRGFMSFKSNVVSPVQGSFQRKNDFNFPYKSAFLSYPVADKWTLGLEYVKSSGWTSFSLEDEFCSGFCGHGSSRIRLHRYSLYIERQLFDWRNIFKITSYVKVIYEDAVPSGPFDFGELRLVNEWQPTDTGPYTEWQVVVQPLQGRQVLPGVAIRLNLKLFWRLYFHFEYGATLGHRDFQKLFFENNYLGQAGTTGEWSSNGTLQYRIWGLSVKFMGEIERFEKGKSEWF